MLLVGLLVIVQLIGAIMLFSQMPPFPTGWDAPYYISHSRIFLESGDLGVRFGSVSIMSVAHSLTGISLINLYRIYPIFLSFLLAAGTAVLTASFFKERQVVFGLVFIFTFWYQSYFVLSLSTYDNALALGLTLFSLFSLRFADRGWRFTIPFFLLSSAVALIHFETFIFLLIVLSVYYIGAMILSKSIITAVLTHMRSMAVTIATIVIGFIQWQDSVAKLIRSYTTRATESGNAAIPYVTNSNMSEFLRYAKSGISDNLTLLFVLLGAIMIVSIIWSVRRSERSFILSAYLLASYGLLAFSVFRGSIPINRSVLLLPVPLLVAIGIYLFTKILYRQPRSAILFPMAALILLFIVINPIPAAQAYITSFPLAIEEKTYEGLVELNTYLEKEDITQYVVLTNTPNEYKAASAYYNLWRNWGRSILPLSVARGLEPCFFFGNAADLFATRSTIRSDNDEYTAISSASVKCVRTMSIDDVPVFVIDRIYKNATPPSLGEGYELIPIGDHVLQVIPAA